MALTSIEMAMGSAANLIVGVDVDSAVLQRSALPMLE